MKSLEELNNLKAKIASLSKELAELTEEELSQVFGGSTPNSILGRGSWGPGWGEKD